jgi:hypothetical protein
MDGTPFEWVWIIMSGVVGSGLHAIATQNRRLLPARIDIGLSPKRLVRPGLLMNLVVGGVASAGCFGLCLTSVCAASRSLKGLPLTATGGGVAMAIGFLAARWVTLEADNRLLRFVVFAALGTPAVHPDTVRALETASSEEICRTVEGLMPRRARHP